MRLVEPHDRRDVARRHLGHRLLQFAAQAKDLRQPLVGAGVHVVEVAIGLECALIDAEQRVGALLRIDDRFEDEGYGRGGGVRCRALSG